MKINVNNELMIAAAQIVAVQIQQDPSKGTQDELPRALHQAYYAIWLAARRLEHGADPNS
jgi:hypothetical protein